MRPLQRACDATPLLRLGVDRTAPHFRGFTTFQNVQFNPPLTVFTTYCSKARLEIVSVRSYSAKIFKNLHTRLSQRKFTPHSVLLRLARSITLMFCTG